MKVNFIGVFLFFLKGSGEVGTSQYQDRLDYSTNPSSYFRNFQRDDPYSSNAADNLGAQQPQGGTPTMAPQGGMNQGTPSGGSDQSLPPEGAVGIEPGAAAGHSPQGQENNAGEVSGRKPTWDRRKDVDFDEIVDSYIKQIQQEIGKEITFDPYGRLFTDPEIEKYHIQISNTFPQYFTKSTMDTLDLSETITMFYHNNKNTSVAYEFEKTFTVDNVYEWKASRTMFCKKQYSFRVPVPCLYDPGNVNYGDVYLGNHRRYVPSDHATGTEEMVVSFNTMVPPHTTSQIDVEVTSRETLWPFAVDVFIEGFVVVCFDTPLNDTKCWGWPINKFQGGGLQRVGNKLKFQFWGIFHGSLGVSKRAYETLYRFVAPTFRNAWAPVMPTVVKHRAEIVGTGLDSMPVPVPDAEM